MHGQKALPVATVQCNSAWRIFQIDLDIDCKLYGKGIVLEFLKIGSCIKVDVKYCSKKTAKRWRGKISNNLVSNFLRMLSAKIMKFCHTVFNKVIAKIKRVTFFAPQCIWLYTFKNTERKYRIFIFLLI